MAVPDSMLLPWEMSVVEGLANNTFGDLEAMEIVADGIPFVFGGDDLDQTLAVAERLVILARKAVELRNKRREDDARANWNAKDAHPECP